MWPSTHTIAALYKGAITADLVFVIGSAFLALRSLVFAVRATRVGVVSLRKLHAKVAALSALYVTSYLVVTFSDVDRLTWSTIMLGVSWIVWWDVWTGPSKWSIEKQKEIEDVNRRVHGSEDA